MNQESNNSNRDRQDNLEGALRALHRAAERAREIARVTCTPLVYEIDGELVYEYVSEERSEE